MRLLSLILLAATVAHGADNGVGSITGVVRCQNQAVPGAIVYLNLNAGRAAPTNLPPVTLRQVQGAWVPRVQLARSGAVLVLKNDDPTLHVVLLDLLSGTNQPRRLVTEAMPYAGYAKAFQLEPFREPVLLKATTGNGEGAVGYVAILPHPWGALTDDQGRFSLPAVPAGSARIFIWHETHGTLMRETKVVSGRATELPVELPAP